MISSIKVRRGLDGLRGRGEERESMKTLGDRKKRKERDVGEREIPLIVRSIHIHTLIHTLV